MHPNQITKINSDLFAFASTLDDIHYQDKTSSDRKDSEKFLLKNPGPLLPSLRFGWKPSSLPRSFVSSKNHSNSKSARLLLSRRQQYSVYSTATLAKEEDVLKADTAPNFDTTSSTCRHCFISEDGKRVVFSNSPRHYETLVAVFDTSSKEEQKNNEDDENTHLHNKKEAIAIVNIEEQFGIENYERKANRKQTGHHAIFPHLFDIGLSSSSSCADSQSLPLYVFTNDSIRLCEIPMKMPFSPQQYRPLRGSPLSRSRFLQPPLQTILQQNNRKFHYSSTSIANVSRCIFDRDKRFALLELHDSMMRRTYVEFWKLPGVGKKNASSKLLWTFECKAEWRNENSKTGGGDDSEKERKAERTKGKRMNLSDLNSSDFDFRFLNFIIVTTSANEIRIIATAQVQPSEPKLDISDGIRQQYRSQEHVFFHFAELDFENGSLNIPTSDRFYFEIEGMKNHHHTRGVGLVPRHLTVSADGEILAVCHGGVIHTYDLLPLSNNNNNNNRNSQEQQIITILGQNIPIARERFPQPESSDYFAKENIKGVPNSPHPLFPDKNLFNKDNLHYHYPMRDRSIEPDDLNNYPLNILQIQFHPKIPWLLASITERNICLWNVHSFTCVQIVRNVDMVVSLHDPKDFHLERDKNKSAPNVSLPLSEHRKYAMFDTSSESFKQLMQGATGLIFSMASGMIEKIASHEILTLKGFNFSPNHGDYLVIFGSSLKEKQERSNNASKNGTVNEMNKGDEDIFVFDVAVLETNLNKSEESKEMLKKTNIEDVQSQNDSSGIVLTSFKSEKPNMRWKYGAGKVIASQFSNL